MVQPQTKSRDRTPSDEITFRELILKVKDLFHFLYSRWRLIVLAGLTGVITGLAYSYYKDPIYTATTTFVLEDGSSKGGGLGQYAGLASMVGVDLGGGTGGLFQGDNILELYKSRRMIEKTLLSKVRYEDKEGLLVDYYITTTGLRKDWSEDDQLKNIKFEHIDGKKNTRLQDSILGEISDDIYNEHLSVSKPDKKLSIIKVEVKAIDEFFAKVFNDQIVKNVNDFYVQTKTKKALENLAILQHQTDSVRNMLNTAIYQTAAVADATPNLNPSRQILRAPVQRYAFNAEANKAILTQLVQNLELAKLSLRKETPLIQVIDGPTFPLYRESAGKLKSMILGALLFGTIVVFCLALKLILKNI